MYKLQQRLPITQWEVQKKEKKCCFLHTFFTINEPPSVKCQTLLGKGSLKSEAYYPLAHFQWLFISAISVEITFKSSKNLKFA